MRKNIRIKHALLGLILASASTIAVADADLEAKGYDFLTPPTKYTKEEDSEYMKAGTYTEMIFYDPDGVLVSVMGFEPK